VVRLLLPLEDDVEDGVQAVLAREDAPELAFLDAERMGGVTVAVEDARDPALRAQTSGRRAPARLALFHLQRDSFAGHVRG
jgi:hypothetical protein